jgi:hypothetical protein
MSRVNVKDRTGDQEPPVRRSRRGGNLYQAPRPPGNDVSQNFAFNVSRSARGEPGVMLLSLLAEAQ